jgi:hypothetical protein
MFWGIQTVGGMNMPVLVDHAWKVWWTQTVGGMNMPVLVDHAWKGLVDTNGGRNEHACFGGSCLEGFGGHKRWAE